MFLTYEPPGKHDWLIALLCLCIPIGFCICIAIAGFQYQAAMQALMDDCMKDHQRYECVAMLSH
jgi:hypothetical protein